MVQSGEIAVENNVLDANTALVGVGAGLLAIPIIIGVIVIIMIIAIIQYIL
jgi:hypothetical protein